MFKNTDLTQGSVTKGLLSYFFPILFGAAFQQLYNTVDAMVVGKFLGPVALAAVGGSSSHVLNLLIGFFGGLAGGATVLIAQYFGAREHAHLKSALHTTVAFSFLAGAFLTVFGIWIAPPFLRWMKTPEESMHYSVQYVRIIFAGVIPGFVYNMGSGILRAMGDSKRPLMFLILACLTNIVLDLVFVIVLKMEVAGVAIATALSQVLSAILVLAAMSKLDPVYAFRFREMRLHKNDVQKILRIGFPAAVQASMYGISNLLIQTFVNELGTLSVAAWTATGKVDSVFWMIMGSFGTTILTFVGQNLGAKEEKRAHEGVKKSLALSIASAIVLSLFLFIFAEPLLGIFTDDPEVIARGIVMIRYLCPLYFVWPLVEIFGGALRGAGDALYPMLITVFGICALRIAWLYIAVPLFPGIETICLSYPVTWVVTGGALVLYYVKRGLKNRLN